MYGTKIRTFFTCAAAACTIVFLCSSMPSGKGDGEQILFPSLEGLAMTGYQGWFNAEGDGSGLGWKHYNKNGIFEPGSCTIDLWPDVSEYEKVYGTSFSYDDGSTAKVFSSRDKSTTDLHFRWMKEYGIDGAFMQRFVTTLKSEKARENYDIILFNALSAAEDNGRAISVMYDLSGMEAEDADILISDWKRISDHLISSPNYLRHNSKPLVAVWGVGFNDNRKYGLEEVQKIITFLKNEGCSVLLGVPAHWRTLSMDAVSDSRLHEIIAQADVVHPWFVGRYNNDSYGTFTDIIEKDIEWCEEHDKTYIPVIFPGFSWYNLKGGVAAPVNQIPRLGGEFLWKQAHGALAAGAKCLYIAMFDEIDEGTAIFKCANRVPVGDSPFLSYEGVEPDRYLWLAGMAAKGLKGEIVVTETIPERR